jgi:phosphatidate cytidylyltransferase
LRFFKNELLANAHIVLIGLLAYALYLLGVWVFSYEKDQSVDMNKVLSSVLVSLYIIGATSSILLVRDVQFGEYYWYFIFIGAWVTDTFAYFTGMLFGKHKLIPAVSPKKTVEGAIGGTVFCIAFFVGFGAIVNHFTDSQINLVLIAFAGLLSALVSMIGDLSMSVIKRTYGIKDYGTIFPGHGGVLDRFDSILAVAVVMAIFLA